MEANNKTLRNTACTVVIFLAGLAMAGCEQTVDMEKYRGEHTLVLNALANTDTTIMASVSATWFFTDTQKPDAFTDLSVELLVNGQSKELLSFSDGLYRSDVRPMAGDRVTLKTVAEGRELTVTDTLPQGVTIDGVDVKMEKVPGPEGVQVTSEKVVRFDYDVAYTYSVSFTDKTPGSHYYFVSVDSPTFNTGTIDYSYDPHFMATAQEINQSLGTLKTVSPYGFPFTNAVDSTARHTIVLVERGAPFKYFNAEDRERVVTIFSITEAYYHYLITLLANSDLTWHGDMTEKGLLQPVKVFSNVKGGTGIFACTTPERGRVMLPAPAEGTTRQKLAFTGG